MGLGTLVTLAASTAAADVTGILMASLIAMLGFLVIPARRRKAKAEMNEKMTALREKISTFWQDYSPDQDPLKDYRERPSLYVPVENFLTEHYPEHFQVLKAAYDAQVAALDEKIAALG